MHTVHDAAESALHAAVPGPKLTETDAGDLKLRAATARAAERRDGASVDVLVGNILEHTAVARVSLAAIE